MRGFRFGPAMCAGVLVACLALVNAGSAAAVAGSSWGTAIEVPGTAALNAGGDARISSMSCPSSGNCVAGGSYTDSSGNTEVFVVDEASGVWGKAIAVPGFTALNTGGFGNISSVSCSSAGNCAAGGLYSGASERAYAFVVDEAGGVWGQAVEVPGTAALNQGGYASVDSVSCAPGSALDCTAAGSYADRSGSWQAFVADEAGGVWGQAVEVPGTAALNQGLADVDVASCPLPGDCTVGGFYTDSNRFQQPFVAVERGGVWGRAVRVTGPTALNAGEFAGVTALSCTSAGTCAAAGLYTLDSGGRELFVADEKNGRWAPATEMPGLAALNAGERADVSSISCASTGNCAAGGSYEDSARVTQAFVINEAQGTWGQAIELPGTATLNRGGAAGVGSVSCATAWNCVAGGFYASYAGNYHGSLRPFVADLKGEVWRPAQQVPGTAALNTGKLGRVSAVSCAPAGSCALGGSYAVATQADRQAFVDSQG